MNHVCAVPGCGRPTKGHSKFCAKHRNHTRRHGDPTQLPLRKGELSAAKKRVSTLIAGRKNAGEVWRRLNDNLEALKAEATAKSKTCRIRWERDAEADIAAACEVNPTAVILTGLAIAFIVAADGKRFLTDRAMFYAAGRQLRLINPDNFLTTINPSTGKRHRTPQDCRPQRLHHAGTRLLTAFGAAGLALHEAAAAAERKKEEARRELTRAITLNPEETTHAEPTI